MTEIQSPSGDPGRRTLQTESGQKPDIIPRDAWEIILGKSAIGTGKFPQSFVGSGIKVAQAMAELSRDRNIPLAAFLQQDPPDELIRDGLNRAKVIAHKAYGFSTESKGGHVDNVWNSDKRQGKAILENVARLVTQIRNGTSTEADSNVSFEHLDEFVSDPLFQGILTTLSDALSQRDVVDISNTYKGLIKDFMAKYAPNPHIPDKIPEGYRREQQELMREISRLLRSGARTVTGRVSDYLHSAEVKGMLQMRWWKGDGFRLRNVTSGLQQEPESLVGDIWVTNIDPYHPPDYF